MRDRRRDDRVRTRFESLYSAGRGEGSGVLVDISYSGAHLEKTTPVPKLGTDVRVYVFVQPVSPFELTGRVVRQMEDGFAIEYKIDDPKVCRLVDDVAALVSVPAAD